MNYATTPAATLYSSMRERRDPFVRRAEKMAAITIPMLFPRDGHTPSSEFVSPDQGIGARGVNHLSSRLLLTLFPATGQFFRMMPDAIAKEFISSEFGDEETSEIEKALSGMEREVQLSLATDTTRVSAAEILKLLPVTGNALAWMPDDGGLQYYPLNRYVVARDAEDNLLCVVIEEKVNIATLPPEVQALVMSQDNMGEGSLPSSQAADFSNDTVCVYTKLWLDRDTGKFKVQKEIKDVIVPGTEGSYTADDVPYRPLRWTKVSGEQYGRGLVEEYYGDLEKCEMLSRAIAEGGLAAARVIGMVAPAGTTDIQDLNTAANGAFVYGSMDDVDFLQLQKYADFRVAHETLGDIIQRLQTAFLLNTAASRDAERLTATEFNYRAQELEAAYGGVYSILSNDFQLPLVKRRLNQLAKKGLLPKLPEKLKQHIKPAIVTGVEALGRNEELNRFRVAASVIQEIAGPEQVAGVTKLNNLIDYVFSMAGVSVEDVTKTEEEIAQEREAAQQQQMLQSIVDKGTGPMAGAMANAGPQPEGGE